MDINFRDYKKYVESDLTNTNALFLAIHFMRLDNMLNELDKYAEEHFDISDMMEKNSEKTKEYDITRAKVKARWEIVRDKLKSIEVKF